ncbi:MAG TPA: hypothetical protein VF654_10485 [Pyrinomonadaceae bacterium]
MRLQRVEEILRAQEIFDPVPSRPTLVGLIEDGTLEGMKTSMGYMVYRRSFVAWVRGFQPQFQIQTIARRPKLRLAANG